MLLIFKLLKKFYTYLFVPTGAALHAFPNPSKEPEKFQTWVTNVGLYGEDPDDVFRHRRICHLHFEKIYQYPSRRLNRLAIPTLHLSGKMALYKLSISALRQ